MKVSEITVSELAIFARLIVDQDETLAAADEELATATLAAAVKFVSEYTGLDAAAMDEFDDLTYAVKVIAAEMIDNRQLTEQYSAKNPTVMMILDMHSTNQLPSVDSE